MYHQKPSTVSTFGINRSRIQKTSTSTMITTRPKDSSSSGSVRYWSAGLTTALSNPKIAPRTR